MEVKAKLKNLQMTPKKVRLVASVVRGLPVLEAQQQLLFMSRWAARPIRKLLDSAIANAENNYKLDRSNLYVKRIAVDEGRTLKRWKPRAFGRASQIRKRMSRVIIILDEKQRQEKIKRSAVRKIKDKFIKKEIPKEAYEKQKQEAVPPRTKTKKPGAVASEKNKPEPFDVRRKGRHSAEQSKEHKKG